MMIIININWFDLNNFYVQQKCIKVKNKKKQEIEIVFLVNTHTYTHR